MKNYFINESIIAIERKNNKTIFYYDNENIVLNKNIKYILERNCLIYGSTLNGRKDYVASILNKKYKIPIIINKNIIFIQIYGIRNKNSLLININKIINYKVLNDKIIINCFNNKKFECNISENNLEKKLVNGLIINNALKS